MEYHDSNISFVVRTSVLYFFYPVLLGKISFFCLFFLNDKTCSAALIDKTFKEHRVIFLFFLHAIPGLYL